MTEQIENMEGLEPEAVEPVEAVDPPEPIKDWSDDEEFEARALGWKPKDEWKGEAPPGFIDNPRAYLDRAETFGPFRKLRERTERLEEHLRKVESVAAKQVERAQQQAEQEYQRRLEAINAQKRKAAEEGDLEAYDKWNAAEQRLERPRPEAVEPVAPQDPITPDLREKHKWVTDPYLRHQGAQLVDQGFRSGELPKGASAQEQAEYAETRLKSYFPHIFNPPKKDPPKPSPVEAGGVAQAARGGFASLPKEAKDAFKRLVAQGVFKDTDEDRKFYHDEYNAS